MRVYSASVFVMPRAPGIRLLAALALLACGRAGAAADEVRFNRDLRPILSNTCFYCHGPDEKKREAKLRLDIREEALKKAESGEIPIVPGKPDESEVIRRIFSTDKDELMPPTKAHKELTPAQKETFRRWIAEGAKYESHWAFMPLGHAEPPAISNCGVCISDWEKREPKRGAELRAKQDFIEHWAKNPIDRFVLDRLLREGIAPSPEADPATLCRRVYLDLTGLLPTPEEVQDFVRECAAEAGDAGVNEPPITLSPRHRVTLSSATAYERLVDRLLASPHYGERSGRHWLDQARYADSNGYTIDSDRAMWPYRDWVIKALNINMPFDQFTIEQLAGDLLPPVARFPEATKSQLIATAFHRNTLINEEGGVDKEQFRNEAVADRRSTIGQVVVRATGGCTSGHLSKIR